MNLAERARATERVLGFLADKPFSWSGPHCIVLAREQGIAMGHDLPPVPKFRTAKGAKKALAARGAKTVAELLDQFFERLPAPAFVLVGDLVTLPAEADGEGLEAVCVADGQGNLFGWHGSDPSRLRPIKFASRAVTAAWRL